MSSEACRRLQTFLLLEQPGTRVLRCFVNVFFTRLGCTNIQDFLCRHYHKLFFLRNGTGSCPCGKRGVGVDPHVIGTSEWERLFQNDTTARCEKRPNEGLTEDALDIRLCCRLIYNVAVEGINISRDELDAIEVVRVNWNRFIYGEIDFASMTDETFNQMWDKLVDSILILPISHDVSSDVYDSVVDIRKNTFSEEERQNLETQVQTLQ